VAENHPASSGVTNKVQRGDQFVEIIHPLFNQSIGNDVFNDAMIVMTVVTMYGAGNGPITMV